MLIALALAPQSSWAVDLAMSPAADVTARVPPNVFLSFDEGVAMSATMEMKGNRGTSATTLPWAG